MISTWATRWGLSTNQFAHVFELCGKKSPTRPCFHVGCKSLHAGQTHDFLGCKKTMGGYLMEPSEAFQMEKMEKMKMYCLRWQMATLDMTWKVRKVTRVEFDGRMWHLPHESARVSLGSCVMGSNITWNCLLKVKFLLSTFFYHGESLLYHKFISSFGGSIWDFFPTNFTSNIQIIWRLLMITWYFEFSYSHRIGVPNRMCPQIMLGFLLI